MEYPHLEILILRRDTARLYKEAKTNAQARKLSAISTIIRGSTYRKIVRCSSAGVNDIGKDVKVVGSANTPQQSGGMLGGLLIVGISPSGTP